MGKVETVGAAWTSESDGDGLTDVARPAHQLGRRLRVALVAPPYFDVPPRAYGGIEAVVADLADALVAHGHEVTLIGAGEPGTSARFEQVWERSVPELLGNRYPR